MYIHLDTFLLCYKQYIICSHHTDTCDCYVLRSIGLFTRTKTVPKHSREFEITSRELDKS